MTSGTAAQSSAKAASACSLALRTFLCVLLSALASSVLIRELPAYRQVHVRGGSILPMQAPALTTAATRRNPFSLLVALSARNDASGRLYWDDGETLAIGDNALRVAYAATASARFVRLQMTDRVLGRADSVTSTVQQSPTFTIPSLGCVGAMRVSRLLNERCSEVNVLGVRTAPTSVRVNGAAVSSFSYSSSTRALRIFGVCLRAVAHC